MATIAIDLDHTLVEGKLAIPGAKDAINLFREYGHKIIIHTCNSVKWAEQVLNDNDIRFDYIWNEDSSNRYKSCKPIADIYIDDRGYRFLGDWVHESLEVLKILGKE